MSEQPVTEKLIQSLIAWTQTRKLKWEKVADAQWGTFQLKRLDAIVVIRETPGAVSSTRHGHYEVSHSEYELLFLRGDSETVTFASSIVPSFKAPLKKLFETVRGVYNAGEIDATYKLMEGLLQTLEKECGPVSLSSDSNPFEREPDTGH